MIEPHNDIVKFIDHTYKELEKHFQTVRKIEFSKFELSNCSIYLVYESKLVFIAGRLSTYELDENGIILEKDNEYLYYNFNENYKNKEKIIKKFVEKYYL